MKKNSSPKTKNPALDKALLAFRRAMNERLIEEARGCGCGLSHFEAMVFIAEKGEVSLKELAEFLAITPPSASVMVDALIEKKMLIRLPSVKDRRSIKISLAAGAHKLFISIHKRKQSVFASMVSKLSNKDKSELARILTTCIS